MRDERVIFDSVQQKLRQEFLSEEVIAVPFGHYEAGFEQEPPANEVLIGREGQRAYLIDLLMNIGRQGAYLVTGRRGSGKTSFVRHCITEYRSEVFWRYLRSNVGRTLFWDRLLLVLLAALVIFLMMMLSQFMEILTLAAFQPLTAPGRLLIWVILIVLALLCSYPLLYGKEVLEVVAGAAFREPSREHQRGHIVAWMVVLVSSLVLWVWSPLGAPALGLSRFFVVLCGLFLFVEATSYCRPRVDNSELKPSLNYEQIWSYGLFPLFLIWGGAYIHLGPAAVGGHTGSATGEFWGNLGVGQVAAGSGALFRSAHQFLIRQPPELKKVTTLGAFWYLLMGFCGCVAGLLLLGGRFGTRFLEVLSVAVVMLGLGIIVLGLSGHRYNKNFGFRPRPLHALAAKAILSLAVGLQLIHPILSLVFSCPYAVVPAVHGSSLTYLRDAISLFRLRSLAQMSPQDFSYGVFHGEKQELCWLLVLLFCVLALYAMEYEWVVRPSVQQRMDRVLAPEILAPWEDQEEDRGGTQRELASMTLPWVVCKAWLPVLAVSVNLGFDRLDHRRVVQAMLAGLRDEYHRTFLAWNSGLANLARAVFLFLVLTMVSLAGHQWFGMPDVGDLTTRQQLELRQQATSGYGNVCGFLKGWNAGPGLTNLLCKIPGGEAVVGVLYYDILEISPKRRLEYSSDHLFLEIVPFRRDRFPEVGREALRVLLSRGIHFRVYHFVLLLVFAALGRWILHWLPLLPYYQSLQRIDAVLDNLSARTSVISKRTLWKPAQWLQGYFTDERQTHQEPVDPRTVEFALLKILRDIQLSSLRLPGARKQLISFPTPEITFIFDELDKLGTRMGPKEAAAGAGKQEAEILDAERRRSVELHKLLADMKNVLSSAPARFIFVGGRNLHDEWLADQTARHPLLTSIFNAEVYLPSLLIDHRQHCLDARVREYVKNQHKRAQLLYARWAKSWWLPASGLPIREMSSEAFVQGREGRSGMLNVNRERNPKIQVLSCRSGQDREKSSEAVMPEVKFGSDLMRDFYHFMTYRSMGNPKKLKELLDGFVRPVDRVVRDPRLRWNQSFDCRHVLMFGDVERFRVQLLADVYRHLALSFEERLVHRDDKLAISVFYLADFLFKFHGRAFSWSNLERVDELVHIHRAPDLRAVLEEIVERWSERFLHPIRNGMYAFRFRSDIAREVEYLSRQSAHEMAAFNFTLDESLALKSLYESNIQRMEPTANQEMQDLVGGLGELHEFDQEYEAARLYYRRAIHALDNELEQVLGDDDGKDRKSLMAAILGGNPEGLENARLFMTWGIARLRLMLQVGLTFEHSRNLERAAVEYRNARTLARMLILAMLGGGAGWDAGGESGMPGEGGRSDDPSQDGHGERRLHMLKNLNILFQPFFAEAWVAEKTASGVDTSVSLAEKELWRIRKLLPFVKDLKLQPSTDPADVRGSNFSLIIAELHNKAADLYFFKGRQIVSLADMQEFKDKLEEKKARKGLEGYLLRAHYHYAVGLHELRRFISHRKQSSRYKFNIWVREAFPREVFPEGVWQTISREGWPDFVYRSIGGTLNDLAEAMLGRVSLFGLQYGIRAMSLLPSKENAEGEKSPKQLKSEMVASFTEWLESAGIKDCPDHPISLNLGGELLNAGSLESWLGAWQEEPDKEGDKRLLRFGESEGHSDPMRLLVSLNFTMVGAKYLERGGYLEDAASELLEVCETVTHYLWWNLSLCRLYTWQVDPVKAPLAVQENSPIDLAAEVLKSEEMKDSPYWHYLVDLAVYALRKADQLFRRSRRAEGVKEVYLVGDKVPPDALTLACSLGLVAMESFSSKEVPANLIDLINGWTGESVASSAVGLREVLSDSLRRHSYPMINRLHGLKVLIDAAVLSESPKDWETSQICTFSWASELLLLKELFDAPMHFTPLHSGVTCALLDLRCRSEVKGGWERSIPPASFPTQLLPPFEEIRRVAQRDLNTSEEMYTMRRAYYEVISDLYYLSDDFNDRQIHFNTALQMAGTELVSALKWLLHVPEALAFRDRPFSEPEAGAPTEKSA